MQLGIDIGDVDLVCQIGSPRSIAAFLQRVGRSGHHVGGVPKGRLFPSSRDELMECAALLDSVRRGELDALIMPPAPLDVLSQQLVAEVACREWDEDALFALVRRAWPYASLPRKVFDEVVRMLADGFSTRYGQRASYLHRDAVHRKLRGRKGARLTATQSGGTIPDVGDYTVLLEPQAITIGTVNEDFAIESLPGNIFQLGNTSWRVLRVEAAGLRVDLAGDGAEAVDMAAAEPPDLILADIQLADGSSGLDAVNELLKSFEVPVVFILPVEALRGNAEAGADLAERVRAACRQIEGRRHRGHRTHHPQPTTRADRQHPHQRPPAGRAERVSSPPAASTRPSVLHWT